MKRSVLFAGSAAEIEHVTRIRASAGDGIRADHGTWIGARLEVVDSSEAKQ